MKIKISICGHIIEKITPYDENVNFIHQITICPVRDGVKTTRKCLIENEGKRKTYSPFDKYFCNKPNDFFSESFIKSYIKERFNR